MSALIAAAIGRARMVLATLVLLMVAGISSYLAIPKESNPDINIPVLYVSVNFDGISPTDAERLLIRPIEQEVRAIEGVKDLKATAFQGGAYVVLEFEAGFDADAALDEVRQKVDLARPELPDGTDEPTVHEVNFSLFPVIVVSLSGAVPERTLLRLARDLKDRLQALNEVLEVRIAGDREELVEVVIDPVLVESYGLDPEAVFTSVGRSNRLVAAGHLDTGVGRFAINVPGLIDGVTDILNLPLVSAGDAVVRVRDIAEVRRHFKDPETYARLDGERAIALEVVKRTGENIIDTIARVRAVVEAERAAWPPGVTVAYLQDQSVDIRDMLTDLQNNVISAVLLVMIVCIGALGVRSGLLVGVAIPGSFLTGILVLAALGLTVNVVVLFSLILAVGMLVDGAIVVTEYADRKMTEGLHRRDAYTLAAQRMAWPITASTATTLAAFVPLLFWPGVVGEFMKFLPITLLATLSASLLMALIFVPTLGSVVGAPGAADPATMKALAASESADVKSLGGLTGAYVRLLDGALNHPALVLTAALATLIGAYAAYGTFGRGVEFFPEVEPRTAVVLVHARGNLSVEEKDALVRDVEALVLDLDGLDSVYTRTGSMQDAKEDVPEDVIGQITLAFADWQTRRPADAILADLRAAAAPLAGIEVETRKQEEGPPVGKPVELELSARDPTLLPAAVAHVRRGMDEIGEVIDIEDSRPMPGIEWEYEVDRAQAAKFGADVTVVGQMVKLVTNGLVLATYRPDDSDSEIDVVARFPTDDRTLDRLEAIRINTSAGAIPIGTFVKRSPKPTVGELQRVDAVRVMTVAGDVPPGVLADDKAQALRAWLADHPLPQGVRAEFKGQDEDQRESEEFLGRAFTVALFVMAIILITQFNSFYSTALILTAVVMSTVGVLLGLLITGQPFGIVMSGIGVIALAGIVVNNNIVLIDTYDRLAHTQTIANARDAVLRTGAQRLRPVLLTTVTTVLGLIPMVLQTNIDFVTREITVGAPSTQWWVQLATAIVFGLCFASVLTLLVTPCALLMRVRIAETRRRVGRWVARVGRSWSLKRAEPGGSSEDQVPSPGSLG